MKNFMIVRKTLLSIMFSMVVSPAFALTITNSSIFNEPLNDGAYITQSAAAGSLFSDEIFTSGDETKSGTVLFSAIPYFDVEGTLYFQFVYDLQETGGNPQTVGGRPISIDDIVVSVSGIGIVWDFDQATYEPILLNTALNKYTHTPLGDGGDNGTLRARGPVLRTGPDGKLRADLDCETISVGQWPGRVGCTW